MRNCYLVSLNDLDGSKDYVRGKIADYLNDLVDIGVKGFRVDASKHMWPGDLEAMQVREYSIQFNKLLLGFLYTVKKRFAVFPTGMSLTKLSPGQELLHYSRPGRVWLVTSRLGTGNSLIFFYSVRATYGCSKQRFTKSHCGFFRPLSCPRVDKFVDPLGPPY